MWASTVVYANSAALVSLSASRCFVRVSICRAQFQATEGGLSPLQTDGKEPPTVVSALGRRIVAIGDLHGDLPQTKRALRLAGVLSNDHEDKWTGGSTVLVQVGDVLDRGGDEISILSLLQELSIQARLNDGAVFQVNGNHETMNIGLEFYDVSPSGFDESENFVDYCTEQHGGDWQAAFKQWRLDSQHFKPSRAFLALDWLPPWASSRRKAEARALLFRPGGPLAMELSRHGVVLNVNGWLFAHGGVLPHHVNFGLDKINHQVSLWMRGDQSQPDRPFIATKGYDSIVWSRLYSRMTSDDQTIQACGTLQATLKAANAKGMIVGHTPQTTGANSECEGKVWRIDVGLSSGVLNADPEVLEIVDDVPRVLADKLLL